MGAGPWSGRPWTLSRVSSPRNPALHHAGRGAPWIQNPGLEQNPAGEGAGGAGALTPWNSARDSRVDVCLLIHFH